MDDIYDKMLARQWQSLIGDHELFEHFTQGLENRDKGFGQYHRQMRHLFRTLETLIRRADVSPVVKTRMYAGLKLRASAIQRAHEQFVSGYADIWEALECSLDDAPMRALSERARTGAAEKLVRDPRTPARQAIRDEWDRWQRREVTYRSDAEFGRKMHVKHPDYTSDRSIAQLSARWRKGEG